MLLGSLLLVAAWEFIWPRRRRHFPALRRRIANIGFWLTNLVLAGLLLGPAATARPRIEAVFGFNLPTWPLADVSVSFVAGFLLLDVLQYAVHRCQHAVPWLWRLHALHHSDPDVDVTTSVRHHPIEYLIASMMYWVAVLVVEIPAVVVMAHALTVFAAAAVTHGNIRMPIFLEQALRPLFITLDLHRIHHSIDVIDANSNYGAVLSVWDRIFGTLRTHPATPQKEMVFGVQELSPQEGISPVKMVLTPWLLGKTRTALADA